MCIYRPIEIKFKRRLFSFPLKLFKKSHCKITYQTNRNDSCARLQNKVALIVFGLCVCVNLV